MNDDHKFFVKIMVTTAVTVAVFLALIARADGAVFTCPTGTYNAGDFCKAEPTGCPYGDSIPLDSPKCAAPIETPETSITAPAENDGAPVTTEENWGK